ncbi:SWIM-type domain-containing protein [Madurella fahalii]|uniref:SWIM-type domain-containing protein n=1 Tax=Madurella fahalii TaxID=1157608 RepID=A0ABQ0FX32_9PEZI
MSVSPTTGMSKLSLECGQPIRHDQSRMQSLRASPSMPEPEPRSDVSDWEADDDDDEQSDIVSSPTGFKYNISRLSPQTRQMVRGLFSHTPAQEPPQISLELCGIREGDPSESGRLYAFQMHEVVPCSIRIGARNGGRFSTPRCECPDARYRHVRPCKHLIWLFDKISKHALYDHDPNSELTLTEFGFPEELGDPFDLISQIRLDILADGLHCDTSDLDRETPSPSRARMREAREMVAAVAGIQPWETDDFRPDLEHSYNDTTLIRRGDLGATLFSLILASHSLAEWVRSQLSPSDAAVDPFRSIQRRVSRIIDEYSLAVRGPDIAAADDEQEDATEDSLDVTWASTQIRNCVRKIENLVSRGPSPLCGWARSSAARSLVGILKAVVSNRSLYMRLVGDHDTGFVYSALDMLADQSQFIEELEDIMESIGIYGAPPSYVAKMRGLISRMRSHNAEYTGTASGSGIPRSNTPPPPLGEYPSADAREPPQGSSTTVQFLTPETPASANARRGTSGARGRDNPRGWKRPVSQAGAQGSRDSNKRARGS